MKSQVTVALHLPHQVRQKHKRALEHRHEVNRAYPAPWSRRISRREFGARASESALLVNRYFVFLGSLVAPSGLAMPTACADAIGHFARVSQHRALG